MSHHNRTHPLTDYDLTFWYPNARRTIGPISVSSIASDMRTKQSSDLGQICHPKCSRLWQFWHTATAFLTVSSPPSARRTIWRPDGHFNFPHPWPGQIPPAD